MIFLNFLKFWLKIIEEKCRIKVMHLKKYIYLYITYISFVSQQFIMKVEEKFKCRNFYENFNSFLWIFWTVFKSWLQIIKKKMEK